MELTGNEVIMELLLEREWVRVETALSKCSWVKNLQICEFKIYNYLEVSQTY